MESDRNYRGSSTSVIEELDKILAYNHTLTTLSQHANKEHFPPRIGPISVIGGEYDNDHKMDELKQLYRAYLTKALSIGHIEDEKFVALNQLKNTFGLGNHETELIAMEITMKAYRRRLSQVVSGGDLEVAPSKVVFLQCLCDDLHFDPQKASEVHEYVYRQKLQQCVADGDLSEEDVAALLYLRVVLCIPQEVVDVAHEDIYGRLFQKVVGQVVSIGIEGYDLQMRATVQKVVRGLHLSKESIVSITRKAKEGSIVDYTSENGEDVSDKKMLHQSDTMPLQRRHSRWAHTAVSGHRRIQTCSPERRGVPVDKDSELRPTRHTSPSKSQKTKLMQTSSNCHGEKKNFTIIPRDI